MHLKTLALTRACPAPPFTTVALAGKNAKEEAPRRPLRCEQVPARAPGRRHRACASPTPDRSRAQANCDRTERPAYRASHDGHYTRSRRPAQTREPGGMQPVAGYERLPATVARAPVPAWFSLVKEHVGPATRRSRGTVRSSNRRRNQSDPCEEAVGVRCTTHEEDSRRWDRPPRSRG